MESCSSRRLARLTRLQEAAVNTHLYMRDAMIEIGTQVAGLRSTQVAGEYLPGREVGIVRRRRPPCATNGLESGPCARCGL